ncbi:hypothetical protein PGT21_008436 [Puccinia graminis f. sp. tritici]|uniref:Tet-like 2OG-Fe(II) oxygenase domain-containing protein n=1 Tax=Puccinia graminis f. sp. tritici TaxID=56615 RepID=A0A5B0Q5G9_PUCGR|nr:hypothetical protein PGT21_008436 [Puccinia graminis f. sp. tritici]
MSTIRSIRWQRLNYYPNSPLCPTVPWNKDTNKPLRHPTAAEVSKACRIADRKYYLMNFGRVVLVDPSDEDSVIAVMEFTPWDQLTEIDKENLNFISTFLHQSKEFINPVSSSTRSWGGKMWGIGWRKSQDFMQIFGRYIKAFPPSKMEKFDNIFQQSKRLGEILGDYYKPQSQFLFTSSHFHHR